MPAQKVVTKERIIEVATAIAKEKGLSFLNARYLAKRIGCSTQPIYHAFKNMEEVKEAVLKKSVEIYQGYIEKEIERAEYPTFKCYGMGYIMFAKEEKELFHLLYMRERKERENEFIEMEPIYALLMKRYELSHEQAVLLHLSSWIFVHGIATQLATSYFDWTREEISSLLSDNFNSYLMYIKKEGTIHEND